MKYMVNKRKVYCKNCKNLIELVGMFCGALENIRTWYSNELADVWNLCPDIVYDKKPWEINKDNDCKWYQEKDEDNQRL